MRDISRRLLGSLVWVTIAAAPHFLIGCASMTPPPSRIALRSYVAAAMQALAECDDDPGGHHRANDAHDCLRGATRKLEPLYREAATAAWAYRTAPVNLHLFRHDWEVLTETRWSVPGCPEMRVAREELQEHGAQLQ